MIKESEERSHWQEIDIFITYGQWMISEVDVNQAHMFSHPC